MTFAPIGRCIPKLQPLCSQTLLNCLNTCRVAWIALASLKRRWKSANVSKSCAASPPTYLDLWMHRCGRDIEPLSGTAHAHLDETRWRYGQLYVERSDGLEL